MVLSSHFSDKSLGNLFRQNSYRPVPVPTNRVFARNERRVAGTSAEKPANTGLERERKTALLHGNARHPKRVLIAAGLATVQCVRVLVRRHGRWIPVRIEVKTPGTVSSVSIPCFPAIVGRLRRFRWRVMPIRNQMRLVILRGEYNRGMESVGTELVGSSPPQLVEKSQPPLVPRHRRHLVYDEFRTHTVYITCLSGPHRYSGNVDNRTPPQSCSNLR